jgi:conjugative transposon TraJ protein
MKRSITIAIMLVTSPLLCIAQGVSGDTMGLHKILEELYNEMIPLSSKLIGVGRGIAGFAATWYIAARVWRHIANSEPVDFYPLLRPFGIGLAILMFPTVLAVINGVMKPTVTATSAMFKDSNKAIDQLLKQKEAAIKNTNAWQMYVGDDGSGDRDRWYKYMHPGDTDEGMLEAVGNDIRFAAAKVQYNFRNSVKQWMSEVLQLLFEAAALCINTIRTFYLVVLAILGPLVFGLSIFDGFTHTLTVWLARYINIFLWLPVANIFGAIISKVQEKMLVLDLSQIQQSGDTFFSTTDTAYLVFMLIGIVGYMTVPSVANYIVNAGGGNTLLMKVNSVFSSGGRSAISVLSNYRDPHGFSGKPKSDSSNMSNDQFGDQHGRTTQSMATHSSSAGYFNGSYTGDYNQNKLSGK